MEDLEITFGGRTRRVRLTLADGAALQSQFGFKSAENWLVTDVLGVIPHLATTNGGVLEAQTHVLALAINRAAGASSKVTGPQAMQWAGDLLDQIAAKQALTPPDESMDDAWKQVLWTVVRAAFKSGWPKQRPVDLDEHHKELRRLFFAKRLEDALEPTTDETTPETSTPSQPNCVAAAG